MRTFSGNTLKGLLGTYKLPSAAPPILEEGEEQGGQEDPPAEETMLLAKKTRSSQVFSNTEFLDDI